MPDRIFGGDMSVTTALPAEKRRVQSRFQLCWRLFVWLSAAAFLPCTFEARAEAVNPDCPEFHDFSAQINYLDPDPAKQRQIRGFEFNHLNADVENLRKGQSASIGADLVFILRIVPNHHRAMDVLMRLALRDRTPRPQGVPDFPVECWLARAVAFSPTDGRARLIYGVYLARIGKRALALSELLEAEKLTPGDVNVSYNLGLLYFEEKDYSRSLEYAHRAYSMGFPLPGLRQKLVKAGHWKD
jgi:tetratricopeptide (TPR) repeat protein